MVVKREHLSSHSTETFGKSYGNYIKTHCTKSLLGVLCATTSSKNALQMIVEELIKKFWAKAQGCY